MSQLSYEEFKEKGLELAIKFNHAETELDELYYEIQLNNLIEAYPEYDKRFEAEWESMS